VNFDSVRVINIGCKTNYHDTQCIENQFQELGAKIINSEQPIEKEGADVFIINSCTVTHKADRDSLQIARRIKKNFPLSKVVLTGCLAELSENRRFSEVDYVVGNKNKFSIPEMLENDFAGKNRLSAWDKKLHKIQVSSNGRTRGFLKIQDGCDSKCAFCTVNLARGPERSLLVADVIDQLEEFVKQGFKEVNLTGIRVGQFGRTNQESLLELLKAIERRDNISLRIRLGSMYPNELTDEFLSFFVSSKKICKHLHISQQSLDDSVLKAMNRFYSVAHFISVVERVKKELIDCFIGCDLIVGFPGETDENFETTYRNLQHLEISDIHVFGFSPRKGTKAFLMINQIDEKLKKQRVLKIKELAREKKNAFYNKAIGRTYNVLFEKNLKETFSFIKGVTDNYISVNNDFIKDLENNIVPMKMTHLEKDFLRGEIVYEYK